MATRCRWIEYSPPCDTATSYSPGGTESVEVRIPARSFAHYDGGWQFERGTFRVLVGRHAGDAFPVLAVAVR